MEEIKKKIAKLNDLAYEAKQNIKKAHIVVSDLDEEYFKLKVEDSKLYILGNFEKAGLTLDIIFDYIFLSSEKISIIEKELGHLYDVLTQKAGDTNEYTTKNEKSAQCIYGAETN